MEVRELFRQDASENGKDPATYEKYLGRLKEEMIDTLADLKRLTAADWVRLEIPIGLVNRIKEMLCDKKPTPIERVNPEFTPVVSRRAIWHALYTIGRDYDQFFTEDQAIRLLVCNHEYPADSTLDPRLPPQYRQYLKLVQTLKENDQKLKQIIKEEEYDEQDKREAEKQLIKNKKKLKKKRLKQPLTAWMVADPYTTKTVNVPDLEKLRRDTFAFSLYNLKPTHVYYNRPMTCFGMGMSDGQKARGGAGKPDRTAQLPNDIRRIEIYYTQNEHQIHSMTFVGDSELTIGNVDTSNTPKGMRKGRMDSTTIPEGDSLHGCEIDMVGTDTFAVTFVHWHPFSMEDALNEENIKCLIGSPRVLNNNK